MYWAENSGRFKFGRTTEGNLVVDIMFELPKTISGKFLPASLKDKPWVFHQQNTIVSHGKTEEIIEYIHALEAVVKTISGWISLLKMAGSEKSITTSPF